MSPEDSYHYLTRREDPAQTMADAMLNLMDWAKTQGVVLHGITPHAFPGRGIGLISTQSIAAGDVVLEVPLTSIKTLDTIPASLRDSLPSAPDTSVHALLALDLTLDASGYPSAWRDVLPSREDISTLPLTWDGRLHVFLPPAARKLLDKQQKKHAKDLAACQAAYKDLDEDAYRHAWLLVNSRTFYHVSPRTARLSRTDQLSLQPVADLFNHAPHGCSVGHDHDNDHDPHHAGAVDPNSTRTRTRNGRVLSAAAGRRQSDASRRYSVDGHPIGNYTITAQTSYPRGVEVPICYGRHHNDFLLVEYGFVLPGHTNDWDETSLDDLLCPLLTRAGVKTALEDAGFWAGYVLDPTEVCFRTQVALRALLFGDDGTGDAAWRRFANGFDNGEANQWRVDAELKMLLEDYDEEIGETVRNVQALPSSVGTKAQRQILVARWEQVRAMVLAAIERTTL